ncbi:MAG TPA: O-methyltransferase [Kofleriaceae bacterium]|jgi:caffeoyl-CoA O-methyltransferase
MADNDSRVGGSSYNTAAVIEFVNRVHVPHDAAMTRAFTVPDGIPAIQVGPSDGALIGILLRLANAKKVVQVGTLVGYSALHIARALPADGKLYSVEYSPRHAEVARANIAAAGFADKVEVVVGPGVEMLPTLVKHGPFDAVFIDADKDNYASYGRWALANVRPGGLILGDNAYLFGNLMEDTARGRAMREFHEMVAARCDSVCAPTPDGLVVGIVR